MLMELSEDDKIFDPCSEAIRGDTRKMNEIIELSKSDELDDKIKSLLLFKDNFDSLPIGDAYDYLQQMRKDSNYEVQQRAEEIFNSTLKDFDDLAKRMVDSITKPIEGLMSTVSSLKSVMDINAAPLYTIPIQTFGQSIIPGEYGSDSVTFNKTEYGELLNSKAYIFLYRTESLVRQMILDFIINPYLSSIDNKIDKKMREECEQALKEETEKSDVTPGSHWVEYLDFSYLYQILEKGRNYNCFSNLMTEEKVKRLSNKLQELCPIRNKIAHSRELTLDEFTKLKIYASDIEYVFSK